MHQQQPAAQRSSRPSRPSSRAHRLQRQQRGHLGQARKLVAHGAGRHVGQAACTQHGGLGLQAGRHRCVHAPDQYSCGGGPRYRCPVAALSTLRCPQSRPLTNQQAHVLLQLQAAQLAEALLGQHRLQAGHHLR